MVGKFSFVRFRLAEGESYGYDSDKKRLENLRIRNKIAKRSTLVVGNKPNAEIKLYSHMKSSLAMALFVLLTLQATVRAQVPFAISTTLTNGTFIRSVAVADVNNDGQPDLICVRANPSAAYVWTNSGNGTFVSNASYTVGSFPYQVIAADVNNDGHPDLITANNSGNSLTVLTNDGYGNFVLASTLSTGSGSSPHSVAAADFNGDGRLDLVSANFQSASFTVWTNSGNGNFISNVSFKVGTPQQNVPQWVTTADVNGDGKPDIIGGCNDVSPYLFIWTNNGTGGFASAPVPFISSGITCVVAADVNGDGKPDLILLTSLVTTQITVLTNDGAGGFTISGNYPFTSSPYAVVAADVNGDGAVDLITCNQGSNTLTILTNNGKGIFGTNNNLAVGSGPESLAAADINGDGRVDLISGNWNAGTMTVLTNAATFLPQLAIRPAAGNVVVSWPAIWVNWALQQNADLTTTNWILRSGVVSDGTTQSLTIPSPLGNLFFRLSHP